MTPEPMDDGQFRCMRTKMLGADLSDPSSRQFVRDFLLRAIDPENPVYAGYRLRGCAIDQDIADRVEAFQEDDRYKREAAVTDLLDVRAFLLRRVAAHAVWRVDTLLWRGLGRNPLGLWKDYLLLRVPLSLLLGFLLALGSSTLYDWLGKLAAADRAWWIVAASLVLTFYLAWYRLRSVLGPHAGSTVASRTLYVFVPCLVWTAVLLGIASALIAGIPDWRFDPARAAAVASVALPVAALTHFFAGPSLTNPL